jgi:hypothetical protein
MATSGYTARIAAFVILNASLVICVSFAVILLDKDETHLLHRLGIVRVERNDEDEMTLNATAVFVDTALKMIIEKNGRSDAPSSC